MAVLTDVRIWDGTAWKSIKGPTAVSADLGNLCRLGSDGLIYVSPSIAATNIVGLAKVATTGDWNDLINRPGVSQSTVFTTNPAPASCYVGDSLTLTAVAQSTEGPIVYKWQSSPDSATWTDITGAGGASYTFSPTLAQNNVYFRCVASTPTVGSVNSLSAQIKVTTKPAGTLWRAVTAAYLGGASSTGQQALHNGTAWVTDGGASWSTDGLTWNGATTPTSASLGTALVKPAFNNGTWMICRPGGALTTANSIYTSSDGKSWASRTPPSSMSGFWPFIGAARGFFFAFSQPGVSTTPVGTNVNGWRSSDGITWASIGTNPAPALTLSTITAIDATPSMIVVLGNDSTSFTAATATSSAIRSPDGITWSAVTMPFLALWTGLAQNGSRFVAVCKASNRCAYSLDGITFLAANMPATADWSAVTYGNGVFVAVATGSSVAAVSADGITWNTFNLPASSPWSDVVFGGGKFIALNGTSTYAVCD